MLAYNREGAKWSGVGTPHFLKGTIIKGRGLRALREEQTKKNKGRG
jgi:hypothetical protein